MTLESAAPDPAGTWSAAAQAQFQGKALPPSQRPKTAAYATVNDPFTQPQIPEAQSILQSAGVKTVYSKVFPMEAADYTPIAGQVVNWNPALSTASIPVTIFQYSESPDRNLNAQAWAAAFVLIAFVLLTSLVSRVLLERSRRRLGQAS